MRCPPVEVPTCIRRCWPPRSYRNAASAAFFIGAVVVIFVPLATIGFGFTPSYFLLTRFARPSGQPAAVTSLRYVGLRERESNQRESAPGIRVSLRETPLAPALFRGSARRAIHGPTCLVWHPCQTPLSTTPPLSLLTGPGDRGACTIRGSCLDREELRA